MENISVLTNLYDITTFARYKNYNLFLIMTNRKKMLNYSLKLSLIINLNLNLILKDKLSNLFVSKIKKIT